MAVGLHGLGGRLVCRCSLCFITTVAPVCATSFQGPMPTPVTTCPMCKRVRQSCSGTVKVTIL
eukprot:12923568-Heterocapsa_arctica.AAC.1